MPDIERRKNEREYASALKRHLNAAQALTLRGLEQFGWELKFIRRPPFEAHVAVVSDANRAKYAVLETDGTLNENPDFPIRDP